MNKIDKLKERLVPFVNEGTSETSVIVPTRVLCGFKLEIIGVVLQDLLRDKYHKEVKLVNFEDRPDGYVYNFKVAGTQN
jgi:hypothetical protein